MQQEKIIRINMEAWLKHTQKTNLTNMTFKNV